MLTYLKKHFPFSPPSQGLRRTGIFHFPLLVIMLSLALIAGCSKEDGKVKTTKKQLYTCTMHPQVISDKPGVCPICGMELVKKVSDESEVSSSNPKDTTDMVSLSGRKQVLANISTVKVIRENINKTITAYSSLDFAEQNKKLITARFNGRIEKLYIDKTGDYIHKGTPLFEIYSPDLVQAQNEYLIAMNGFQNAKLMSSGGNDNPVFSSAKQKLLLYGLTESQVAELEKTKSVKYTLTYYSPFNGTVIEKKVEEGMYVNEGTVIYDIADLSTLWNLAEVYENDLNLIKEGSKVLLKLSSYPGETFEGKVTLIYPVVNAETRTIKVRSSFVNSKNKLKPNMYGETIFAINSGSGLVIPEEAILFTGKRNIVWTKVGDKTFEAREVTLGTKLDGRYQVLSGLNEGDELATSGAYLIDSESQLKRGLTGHQHGDSPADQKKSSSDGMEGMNMPK